VPDDLQRYYPASYYNLMPEAELDRAADRERSTVELLLRFQSPARLLEIGAGYGVFARAAKRAGFDVTAVEMDQRCCDYLRSVVGVRAVHSDAPEEVVPELDRYETIVMWHVLEHLRAPGLLLERLAARLEPGGLLAVATPNPEALQFRILGARWAHVDAPRHLCLIPQQSLVDRAGGYGLQVVHRTAADRYGRIWNRFGWDYAFRRSPAARSPSPLAHGMGWIVSTTLYGLEGSGLNGATYTVIFVKPDRYGSLRTPSSV
jgi:SAM-dependent methyltransferase